MDKKTVNKALWQPGVAPIAVVLITLNEAHNLEEALENIKHWAQEVFIVDSFSDDNTVDIALRHGVHIVQRSFKGFGDQWNFALNRLPIAANWTMKLDPDERLSKELKDNILQAITSNSCDGMQFHRRWWLMGTPLPIRDTVLRVWRTGLCSFTEVSVNEHPLIDGKIKFISGDMEHLDSPNLHHWIEKQNQYSSTEAVSSYLGDKLAEKPRLFGNALQRRMWIKKYFYYVPGRYKILFWYFFVYRGLWRAGKMGFHSAHLWTEVYRWKELKELEMKITGHQVKIQKLGPGRPNPRASTIESD